VGIFFRFHLCVLPQFTLFVETQIARFQNGEGNTFWSKKSQDKGRETQTNVYFEDRLDSHKQVWRKPKNIPKKSHLITVCVFGDAGRVQIPKEFLRKADNKVKVWLTKEGIAGELENGVTKEIKLKDLSDTKVNRKFQERFGKKWDTKKRVEKVRKNKK
jgi:hypothetical protein